MFEFVTVTEVRGSQCTDLKTATEYRHVRFLVHVSCSELRGMNLGYIILKINA
jgi:hypothetical protein